MTTNEPIEWTLRRIEAAAELAAWSCPHCRATLEVNEVSEGGVLPRAIGVTHEDGCPDWVDPDGPAVEHHESDF